MINIVDMTRGMADIRNFYGCEPFEIIKIDINHHYIANIELNNGDKWRIGYAGQVEMISKN